MFVIQTYTSQHFFLIYIYIYIIVGLLSSLSQLRSTAHHGLVPGVSQPNAITYHLRPNMSAVVQLSLFGLPLGRSLIVIVDLHLAPTSATARPSLSLYSGCQPLAILTDIILPLSLPLQSIGHHPPLSPDYRHCHLRWLPPLLDLLHPVSPDFCPI
jgi:hypothetical protein